MRHAGTGQIPWLSGMHSETEGIYYLFGGCVLELQTGPWKRPPVQRGSSRREKEERQTTGQTTQKAIQLGDA